MPRDNRRAAHQRPGIDVGASGRQPTVDTRVVGERADLHNRATALASALKSARPVAEQYLAQRQDRINRQDRLAAVKAAYSDHASGLSPDQAAERKEFASTVYRDNYLRTHDSLQASDMVEKLASDIATHRNDPDYDAEAHIDHWLQSAVDGMDDPDQLDVMMPRLVHETEELKAKVLGQRLDEQRDKTLTQFNAWTADLVGKGAVTGPDALALIRKRGAAQNIAPDKIDAAVVDSVYQHAMQTQDPADLGVLFAKNAQGVALVDDPDLADSIHRMQARVEAEHAKRRTAGDLNLRIHAADLVERGGFTSATARRLQQDHPDIFSDAALAQMVARSHRRAESATRAVHTQAALNSGQFWQLTAGLGPKKTQAALNERWDTAMSDHPDDPQAGLSEFVNVLQANGGGTMVKSKRLAALLNSGAAVGSQDGTMPQAFARSFAAYKQIKKSPAAHAILANHLDPEAEKRLAAFDHFRQAGDTDNEAYAQMQAHVESEVPLDEFRGSEASDKLDTVIDDRIKSGWFSGPDRDTVFPGNVRQTVKRYAEDFARMGLPADTAVELAGQRFDRNYTQVKGTYVYTGANPLPRNMGDVADRQIEKMLPGLRRSLGNPALTVDDFTIHPSSYDPNRIDVYFGNDRPVFVENEDGDEHAASFYLGDALQAQQAADTEADAAHSEDLRKTFNRQQGQRKRRAAELTTQLSGPLP